jgi:hypothetical protein
VLPASPMDPGPGLDQWIAAGAPGALPVPPITGGGWRSWNRIGGRGHSAFRAYLEPHRS